MADVNEPGLDWPHNCGIGRRLLSKYVVIVDCTRVLHRLDRLLGSGKGYRCGLLDPARIRLRVSDRPLVRARWFAALNGLGRRPLTRQKHSQRVAVLPYDV